MLEVVVNVWESRDSDQSTSPVKPTIVMVVPVVTPAVTTSSGTGYINNKWSDIFLA